jgi:hypothetical protein
MFLSSFFNGYNSRIYSNHVVDDPHFSYITKLKKSNKKPISLVVVIYLFI